MKKQSIFKTLFVTIPLLLSGCSGGDSKASNLDIEFDFYTPTAYIGEEYDFSEVLIIEKDVNYHLDVYYFDYYEKQEKTVEVRNIYYFTPLELFGLEVVVTASKGKEEISKTKMIQVSQRVDPIDELLNSGGYSGWADTGITKELVTDETFIKGEESYSSLSVRYQGSNPYHGGTTFLTLNNFRLLPYWSDDTWENGVLRFWVFNPNEERLVFQLRIYDELTKTVNIDWGHFLMKPQYAPAGQWTEIIFSLRHLGVTHTLFADEEGTRNDNFNVKVRYEGTPEGSGELYGYQFYVDDVDVVPYSKDRFPDLDTTCYATAETIEYGWENMTLDNGWNRSIALFNRELVNSTPTHESLSSLFLQFQGITPDANNGYSLVLSPEEQFGVFELPSFRHGTLDFDVLFTDDVVNHDIEVFAVNNGWLISARAKVVLVDTNNEKGWFHATIDFGEHGDFYNITQGIRLGFSFPGINADNKNDAIIYLDNIIFNQKGGIPEEDIPVIRGIPFGPGYAIDLYPISLTETIVIDFKFTSNDETVIRLMVGQGWDNYYGYYLINFDGTLGGEYDGVTISILEDGYYRVSLALNELSQGQDIEGISQIDLLYLKTEDDSASGYIDFINPTVY